MGGDQTEPEPHGKGSFGLTCVLQLASEHKDPAESMLEGQSEGGGNQRPGSRDLAAPGLPGIGDLPHVMRTPALQSPRPHGIGGTAGR